LSVVGLPRRFLYTGDIPFESFLAEADAAEVEIAHEAARAATLEATAHDPRFEFRGAVRLYDHRFLCH